MNFEFSCVSSSILKIIEFIKLFQLQKDFTRINKKSSYIWIHKNTFILISFFPIPSWNVENLHDLKSFCKRTLYNMHDLCNKRKPLLQYSKLWFASHNSFYPRFIVCHPHINTRKVRISTFYSMRHNSSQYPSSIRTPYW